MNDMMQTYPNAYYNLQNQLMQQQIANRMNTGAYLPQVQVVRVRRAEESIATVRLMLKK